MSRSSKETAQLPACFKRNQTWSASHFFQFIGHIDLNIQLSWAVKFIFYSAVHHLKDLICVTRRINKKRLQKEGIRLPLILCLFVFHLEQANSELLQFLRQPLGLFYGRGRNSVHSTNCFACRRSQVQSLASPGRTGKDNSPDRQRAATTQCGQQWAKLTDDRLICAYILYCISHNMWKRGRHLGDKCQVIKANCSSPLTCTHLHSI